MTLDQKPPLSHPKNHPRKTRHRGALDPVDFAAIVRSPSSTPVRISQKMTAAAAPKDQSRGCTAGGSCFLDLLTNPKRLGVIPGLDFTGGTLSLNPARWTCCQALGQRSQTHGAMTYRCDLRFRYEETKALMALIQHLYPDANLMEIFAPSRFSVVLDQLAAVAAGQSHQGRFFARERQKYPIPTLFWATAFAALWRFGLRIKLKNFTQSHEVLLGQKRTEHHEKNSAKDDFDLLMVYHVTDLWSARSFETLDYLMTTAYNGCKPLFIDLSMETVPGKVPSSAELPPQKMPVTPSRGVRSTKAGFQNLIAQARKKTTVKIYSPGFLRKLRTVSAGIPRGIFESDGG